MSFHSLDFPFFLKKMGNLDCFISLCWNGTREQTGYVGISTFIRDSYIFFKFWGPMTTFWWWIFEFNCERQSKYGWYVILRKPERKPILVFIEPDIIICMHQITLLYSLFYSCSHLSESNRIPGFNRLHITDAWETIEINNLSDICTMGSSSINLRRVHR